MASPIDMGNYLKKKGAAGSASVDSATTQPHDDDAMSERVATLEQTVETIRAEMRANSAEVREIINTGIAGIRIENANVRTEVHESLSSFKTFLIGTIIALLGIAASSFFKSATTPPQVVQQPPFIIQVPPYAATPPQATAHAPNAFDPQDKLQDPKPPEKKN